MSSKVNITVPKAIWTGDFNHYRQWCWETYGRYLQAKQMHSTVELNIKFSRF